MDIELRINPARLRRRARTAEARSRYEQMRQASKKPGEVGRIPEALQSQVITNLRAQYAQVARAEAELQSIYGPRHPAITSGNAQKDDLRRQIDREISRVATGTRNEFEAAQSRERSLEASLAASKEQSATINQANIRLRELEREAQASRVLFEQFLARFKETSEQQALQKADARIISPAAAPLRPTFPRPGMLLAISAAGGLVIGIGLAAVKESLARGFMTARDVESSLSLPVLGVVPLVATGETAPAAERLGWLRGLRNDVAPALTRFAVDRPSSPFGEALGGLRARFRAMGLMERSQVLLVTSALPGEGKSTVDINLAHMIAKSGSSTLLIDADFRNSALTRPGALGSRAGLFQVLRDGCEPEQLIETDSDSGLHFLSAGPVDGAVATSDLLASAAMKSLVTHARAKFDLVILDGPPLLHSVDSSYLFEHANWALLVLAWGRTDRDSVVAALERVGAKRDKVAGVALNKVDPSEYRLYDEV